MRFRSIISSLIFGTGCALSFIGALAVVLPRLSLPQLQLVLDSFSMSSGNAVVSSINAFASFVLEQSWQTLATGVLLACAGIGLLVYFSKKAAPMSEPPTESKTEAAADVNVPECNPFAVERSVEFFEEVPFSLPAIRAKPILEPNVILEEAPSEETACKAAPYVSARFADEVQAIETESGQVSQSGSRILIRTAFEPLRTTETPAAPKITPLPEPSVRTVQAPQPEPPTTSRIRSTMGRHSAAKRNLPIHHS